ncbi:beta-1,6-N-acetylglucosaminyltransferase [Oceanirhabdus sp. W0125-5]|uniref:beta-1,6-N-acetylglucosaminyltransferase n=1 Tax=Oceanirhabdus sp. W0125-5 TaxID=2999116 RepID=UPI0022F2B153|nr:beta-1,6-N-acetylglucosaminyltransferase [Oceanirhabdus sp. W0125-5]WBW96647.1 beta-1,6-N-acetylglucosaminyltransferase [Oceanirhabdus sp. W0125-5]
MNIAYLILAHKSPTQLIRLINTLNCENAYFFIHIDKKSSNYMLNQIINTFRNHNNIYYIDRCNCSWGDFSIVQATMKGIEHILNTNLCLDYVILLSGQDYPIKPNYYIRDFLIGNYGKCFIHNFPVPLQGWHNGFHHRIPKQYRLPSNISLYGGSQWWGLTKECIKYIYDFVINNPDFVQYCKHLYVPDEIFFQTIVLNSHFKQTVVNTGLRYIDWDSVPHPKTHPAILTKNYFPILNNSRTLFARKFDIDIDSQILDMIDNKIL